MTNFRIRGGRFFTTGNWESAGNRQREATATPRTTGGFYEKRRGDAALHFLYVAGQPQKWYVHFDLYSPVYSLVSLLKHVRYEFVGKLTPDWRMIQKLLKAQSGSPIGA